MADDGDATPNLIPGSEAFRFVCISCIAWRVSRFQMPRAQRFSQERFSEGVPGFNSRRVRISSKLSQNYPGAHL